jgi:4-methylaminobutanoate oxidase (formaldehyde-forming)
MDARLVDVTSMYSTLSLMGPQARLVLEKLTRDDVSNVAFPFGTWRTLHIAGAPVRALRVTYVGELGWELHIPVEFAATVYDALMQAGQALGIRNAGYRAIETLRLEKGYRAFGSDIGPDHTPYEAGLGWLLKMKSGLPFIGREALEKLRDAPLRKKLVCFTVDDPSVVLLGRETLYRNGERVGWVGSAGFGHTIGKPIAYGYVRQPEGDVTDTFVLSGQYELDVATVRVPATAHLNPLYDPQRIRILG